MIKYVCTQSILYLLIENLNWFEDRNHLLKANRRDSGFVNVLILNGIPNLKKIL